MNTANGEFKLSAELVGVLIGGGIGLAGSLLIAAVDWRKWKQDRKAAHLLERRSQNEQIFKELLEKITSGMETGAFDINAIAALNTRAPKLVLTAFDEMMAETDRSAHSLRGHLLKISLAMNTSLRDIDDEIALLHK